MSKPRVLTKCVAGHYAGHDEKIVEFSSGGGGGLIAFQVFDDGKLHVDVYRTDPGVVVRSRPSQTVLRFAFEAALARSGARSEDWKRPFCGEFMVETRDEACETVDLVHKALVHFVGGGRVEFEENGDGRFRVMYSTEGYHANIGA